MLRRLLAIRLTVPLLVFSVSGAGAQAGRRTAFDGKLTPCRVAGLDQEVLCGRHEVFENRAAATGRTIPLNIVVLPASTDTVLDDPLVFLAGGGVVPATRYARFLATSLLTLRRNRDILLVDQRGTGGSNPLTCDRATLDTATASPPEERYLAYVAACRASLAPRADVRLYTTTLAMEDLDDVRAWLGFPNVNLYGASYGTSAAATYVRRFPSRVRTVVMHGVVPLDVPMQVDLAKSAQQSLDRVLDLCNADDACKASYPDLRSELAKTFARFDAAASEAGPGQRRNAGQPFRDALNSALSSVAGIRSVPMLIHDAARGAPPADGGPPPGPEPAPLGVRLSILCSEGLSAIDTASLSRATARTFLGEFPVRFQLRWCEGWPVAALPSDFRTPFRSAAPALLLTGELDPITPPAYADRVKEWFSNSTALVLPRKSHSDTDPCVTGVIERFVLTGGKRPDPGCLSATPPLQFTASR